MNNVTTKDREKLEFVLLRAKMDGIIKRSFNVNLVILQTIGLYFPAKHVNLFKVYAYFMYSVCLVLTSVFGFVLIFLDENFDMMERSYDVIILNEFALYVVKVFLFIYNGENIKKCIHYFESTSTLRILNEEQKQIFEECVWICRRNSFAFVGVIIVGYCFAITLPLWQDKKFPVDIWFPFDTSDNLIKYCVAYIFSAIALAYAAATTVGFDPLIGGLALHASSQLKFLKHNLQHLNEIIDERIFKMSFQNNAQKEMKKSKMINNGIKNCIKHHKFINEYFKKYVDCFSLPIFVEFIVKSILFGLSCLRIIKLPLFSFDFLLATLYFFCMLGQIYFFCYYGTTLLEESNSLNTAIYMSKWYEYDTRAKTSLLIFMESSKRPMIITAGKIFDVSVDTFTTILKRSYSVLAFLKNF